ncbi:MAG: substrate-binding domain-containing protein [Gemmatimonadaceae bacterium]|nr:substrate-binding domain-containing protein [Gemmatimonadaceae bacterium]
MRVIVVVNAANATSELSRDRVSQIFLRQLSTWTNGQEILPVDQNEKSPTRIVFTHDIERQSVSSMRRYWQERIFSGHDAPPPERVTDVDVLTYVRSNPGAIGYVREGTDLGTGVKAIIVKDQSGNGSADDSHR